MMLRACFFNILLEVNGTDLIRVGLLRHAADSEFRGLLRIETTRH
jgi:hypothetical protein